MSQESFYVRPKSIRVRQSAKLVASFHPLIERLGRFVTLGPAECAAVADMTRFERAAPSGRLLAREGSKPDCVCLLIEGFAYRYRYLDNGRRQILGYLLPGDLCDTQFVISNVCDHDIATMCNSQVATISVASLINVIAKFPDVERGLLMMSIVDAAIAREWLLNLGQRDAYQRLGHFFCELSMRLQASDVGDPDDGVSLPLTQVDLADTVGLTMVHVNRILQRFRREGLLNWSRQHFHILNFQRLADLSGFNPGYLRLKQRAPEPHQRAYSQASHLDAVRPATVMEHSAVA